MIRTEKLKDGRTYTYSDRSMKIMREDGVIYDDAADTVGHTYTETDIPIDSGSTAGGYEAAWGVFGV